MKRKSILPVNIIDLVSDEDKKNKSRKNTVKKEQVGQVKKDPVNREHNQINRDQVKRDQLKKDPVKVPDKNLNIGTPKSRNLNVKNDSQSYKTDKNNPSANNNNDKSSSFNSKKESDQKTNNKEPPKRFTSTNPGPSSSGSHYPRNDSNVHTPKRVRREMDHYSPEKDNSTRQRASERRIVRRVSHKRSPKNNTPRNNTSRVSNAELDSLLKELHTLREIVHKRGEFVGLDESQLEVVSNPGFLAQRVAYVAGFNDKEFNDKQIYDKEFAVKELADKELAVKEFAVKELAVKELTVKEFDDKEIQTDMIDQPTQSRPTVVDAQIQTFSSTMDLHNNLMTSAFHSISQENEILKNKLRMLEEINSASPRQVFQSRRR
ncbi:hypothetical protein O9G_001860 [Rozella allomycis CSF55]|uniref:Uncharacterized protein n=1 Tax=Rozella allomycis (strain CSF55) TaxID=988480 RepID=A0A075AZW7_ROZAC|nr:hypothetical protein O9G_001860 [Rozella allomycis CSF55]|eukprot:EPZ34247.1 hypothetical protein O9G_001860 [Rozella allomycis CSF55]